MITYDRNIPSNLSLELQTETYSCLSNIIICIHLYYFTFFDVTYEELIFADVDVNEIHKKMEGLNVMDSNNFLAPIISILIYSLTQILEYHGWFS